MDQLENYDRNTTATEIRQYLYLIQSWAWLIILMSILVGATVYAFSVSSTPIYETSTRLLVSDPPYLRSMDYTSMISSQTMASTYAEMLRDRPVLEGVIEKLNLERTPEALKQAISVEIVRNTQLLVIRVQDPDPKLAATIADTIAEVFTDRISELQSQRYADTRDNLAKQVRDMELQIESTNRAIEAESNPTQLLQLEARLTEYRRLYSDLVTNFETVRLAEAQTSTNVVISEAAAVPTNPVSPRTFRNTALATVLALVLTTGAIFAFDALDDTTKNPEEVRQRFNLPILGVIATHTVIEGQPISEAQPRSPVAESFRALRTNITFTSVDKPLRRVLITSPTPQIGKTTVVANLGVVLAQSEKKVVVVDADMRRPQMHQKFGVTNQLGLCNLFFRPKDVLMYGVIQTLKIPRLALIASGGQPPNPSELLTSRKMGEILTQLENEFDIVLIDTPPVLTVTDAAALTPSVDGVIIVAKPGVTKSSDLQQTVEQIEAIGGRILGIVLNEVNPRSRRYGYYYNRYYSKYTYYYDEQGKRSKMKLPAKKNGSKTASEKTASEKTVSEKSASTSTPG
jgi:non-specific protein-tyrosine kinase